MPQKDINIRDIQKVQLVTLKDVRDFCYKNNLRYYLYCGTLLGCIRHGGFIPWDDDVDLAMPIEDYKKFCRLFCEDERLSEKYTVDESYYNTKDPFLWLKINRRGTIYYDKRFMNNFEGNGISLDIYPLIGEYDNSFAKKAQQLALRLQRSLSILEQHRNTGYVYVKHKKQLPLLKILALIPAGFRAYVISRIRHWFWPDHNKHKHAGSIDAVAFSGKFDSGLWMKTTEGEFEKERFIIPEQFDRILTIMYGNYMQLPPEGMRVTSHGMEEIHMEISKEVAEEAGIDL